MCVVIVDHAKHIQLHLKLMLKDKKTHIRLIVTNVLLKTPYGDTWILNKNMIKQEVFSCST
jgi:hypothetical protein